MAAEMSSIADAADEHRIDVHADQNQEGLEGQGEQGAQVILAHVAGFVAHHGGHGDGGYRGDEVDFDHAAIHDDENANVQRPDGDAHQGGFQPHAKQLAQVHVHQPGFQVAHDVLDVEVGI